jgi:anti-sigma factor RsiW
MKGCSSWMDAITDCALGETPKPDFAAHISGCPRCRNAVQESQAIAARIAEALHRRAAVEPPLYGPERVMARIHRQSDTRRRWRWAAIGSAALAVLIAIVMWVRRPAPEAEVTALATWRSPTTALLRPPVAAAWTTTPRLGDGFFKMKSSGGIHAQ